MSSRKGEGKTCILFIVRYSSLSNNSYGLNNSYGGKPGQKILRVTEVISVMVSQKLIN